ncbi:MAG: type II secretion system F family protein [Patescibacteria group bacterium]|nr:type II secretion system F family protein [Patescibacteria group bacterium]
MLFQYTVSTKAGQIKKGEIEAANKDEAAKMLLVQDLIIISLIPKRVKRQPLFSFGRISELEKINLVRNLQMMIKSGLSLSESLKTLSEQTVNLKLKTILAEIQKRVEQGEVLSSSFALYPKYFSPLFIGVIKTAESSGTLESSLVYLAEQLEKSYELKKKVKASLTYPTIVVIVAILLSLALSQFLLPKILSLFAKLDVSIPLITKIFLSIMNFLAKNTLFILIGLILLVIVFRFLSQLRRIKSILHILYLKLPIFGRLTKNNNLAQFARTSETLLKSGLTLPKSLEVVAETIGNEVYKKTLEKIIPALRRGETLASNLENFPQEFPLSVAKILNVGEKTGNLEDSFHYLADFYETEVDRTIKNLTSVLEPILLIIIGLGVGLLAVSIILPIYQFIGQIGQ